MSVPSEPIIGICAVRERARWAFWDQTAHLVADTYAGAVQRSGAIAVLLPVDVRKPLTLLDRVDGLLLIGGADVAMGGTLEQRPVAKDGSNPHRRVIGNCEGTEHTVTLDPGSLAERAAGETRTDARCHHRHPETDEKTRLFSALRDAAMRYALVD